MKDSLKLIIISLSFWFCSQNEYKTNIDQNKILHESKYISGGSLQLVDSIVYKNSENNFVGEISYVYQWKDLILVGDKNKNCIHVFNKKLQYLYKIGRKGSGPGEYNSPPMIVMSASDTLKVLKVLEKKISLYDSDLKFIRDKNLPNEFLYQFRLPLEINGKLILSIAYPFSVDDIEYFSKYKSLIQIDLDDTTNIKSFYNWYPIYSKEQYASYTTSNVGVALANKVNGSFMAMQRAAKFIAVFDADLNKRKEFGISSKHFKIPPQTELEESQKSFENFANFTSNTSILTKLFYDKINKYTLVSYINKTKESFFSRNDDDSERFLQIYNRDYDCIFDEVIKGNYLFNLDGNIYILDKETSEQIIIKIYHFSY